VVRMAAAVTASIVIREQLMSFREHLEAETRE
jgi:hypothetical protein